MAPIHSPMAVLADFHSSALQLFASSLHRHVPTMRQGIMTLRQGRPLSKPLVKKLSNLDLAYKVIRHITKQYVSSVLSELADELSWIKPPPATSAKSDHCASSPTPCPPSEIDFLTSDTSRVVDQVRDELEPIITKVLTRVSSELSAQHHEVVSVVLEQTKAVKAARDECNALATKVQGLEEGSSVLRQECRAFADRLDTIDDMAFYSQREATPVCRYFLQGKCAFGDDCRFVHPDDHLPDSQADKEISEPETTMSDREAEFDRSAADLEKFPEFTRGVVNYVRCHSLTKSTHLNGKCGAALDYLPEQSRYKVAIHGMKGKPMLIKPQNLIRYQPLDSDECLLCGDHFNLFSCPTCSCPTPDG